MLNSFSCQLTTKSDELIKMFFCLVALQSNVRYFSKFELANAAQPALGKDLVEENYLSSLAVSK